ncbi:MAG: hypothetical protein B7Y80_05155 [Hyphomicrobium sp. 32-62-53]|nr:MAG: hypothetical protein B7Z29_10890 [Hyphomicrobium sp. 12-62-95]OYY00641.1 MAG: hypothetical protein B7Y80_05155 [Hyphomicrobium sp. 32-62-53]
MVIHSSARILSGGQNELFQREPDQHWHLIVCHEMRRAFCTVGQEAIRRDHIKSAHLGLVWPEQDQAPVRHDVEIWDPYVAALSI